MIIGSGLERFKRLVSWFGMPPETDKRALCYVDIEYIEKQLKALEIIKEMFKSSNFQLRCDGKNYFIWDNILMAIISEITHEQYDLLKEVLL